MRACASMVLLVICGARNDVTVMRKLRESSSGDTLPSNQADKLANILQCQWWIHHKITPEERAEKLDTLGSASDWSWLEENMHQPIGSTSHILASDMSSVWSFCVCLAGKLGRRLSNHNVISEI